MNPYGFLVILFGAVIAWVGVRGTQGALYADITGKPYVPGPNGIASAANRSQSGGAQSGGNPLPGILNTPGLLPPGFGYVIGGAANVQQAPA